jgi:hypothetical protein
LLQHAMATVIEMAALTVAITMASTITEARAMAALVAAMAHDNNNNNNNNNATMPTTALIPTTTRITPKTTTTRRTTGGRTAVAEAAATTADQRICHPALLLVLHDAGAAAVLVFVNYAGALLSMLSMAAVVHVSAGQKEEVPADNPKQEAVQQEAEAPVASNTIVDVCLLAFICTVVTDVTMGSS